MSNITGPDSAQSRDRRFERLVEQYQNSLLRMCFLHLRDQALAEDAVQETFMKVYRNMDSFRGESSEKTWLMRIAMNTCNDIHRSHWFRTVDPRYTPDMLPEPTQCFEAEEERLVESVLQLPRKMREVLLLYYYQDMTVNEIADSLGISQSSVSGRLKRAREKLRALLERSEGRE